MIRRAKRRAGHYGVTMFKAQPILLTAAPDAHFHPFGQRVHHRRTHAMQAARNLVGILVELAARMQPRQHYFGSADTFLSMDIHGDAAAIINDGNAAITIQRDGNGRGETRLRFIHRIINNLKGHVMQARAIISVANIHARPFAHRFQPAQDGDGSAVIGFIFGARLIAHAGYGLLFGESRIIMVF